MSSISTQSLEVFFPYANRKIKSAIALDYRFVHYTRADTAKQLLQSKQFWFRKSSTMNDLSEIKHGKECLLKALPLSPLLSVIEGIFPTYGAIFEDAITRVLPSVEEHTYIASFSRHISRDDKFGRLSMWRAYGNNSGVAIVMNNGPFFGQSTIGAIVSPVAYFEHDQVLEALKDLSLNLDKNKSYLLSIGVNESLRQLMLAFVVAIMSIKHPSFSEEREWRIIYAPKTFGVSPHLEEAVEVMNGIPQLVYKLPLKDIPDANFFGASLPDLIERIIIGPSPYPDEIREAFIHLLQNEGVADAEEKVIAPKLPLRT